MRQRGITLVEGMVTMAIFSIVVAILYGTLSRMYSTTKPSVTRMTTASFVRQGENLAFQKLMNRLEEGIEILSPAPNGTGVELVFKDVLNHQTVLAMNGSGQLVTFSMINGVRQQETEGYSIPTETGTNIAPAQPISIPNTTKVFFQVLSPTLVTIVLTISDTNQTGNLVATARLRNSRLPDQ